MAKSKRNVLKVKPKAVKSGGSGKSKFKKFSSSFLLWSKRIVIGFFIVSILLTVLYRFVNPFFTPLMIIRTGEQIIHGDKIRWKNDWKELKEMSPYMVKAALAAEDQRFYDHNGFEFEAMWMAFKHNQKGRKIRGGSTISQQTAKNVFLWSGRSYVRKAFEAYFTILIELFWSKERILEVYLNVIEMGRGVYGMEAAAHYYYGKSGRLLTKSEAAAIASVFPLPLKWNPTKPSPTLRRKQEWIRRQIDGVEVHY